MVANTQHKFLAKFSETSAGTDAVSTVPLSLALSPTGHLHLYSDPENQETVSNVASHKIHDFFATDDRIALLRLGLTHFDTPLPPSVSFWQQFAQIFVTALCKQICAQEKLPSLPPLLFPADEINKLLSEAPFMRGAEYLNIELLAICWGELAHALKKEVASFSGDIEAYLSAYHTQWHKIGRVCFHLAENKSDAIYPFAFLATYTTRLSKTAQVQHLPLGRALEEYAGENKKSLLLSLLLPVQKATEQSQFLKAIVGNGSIFKPLAWRGKEAFQFLKDIPHYEAAGVMVRVPNWWDPKKPPRPTIKISVGNAKTSAVGLSALLDFNMQVSLPSGERFTQKELQQLLSEQENLVQIKGQWVQIDNEKLNEVLTHWQSIERQVKRDGLSFSEGLRLVAGVSNSVTETISPETISAWSTVNEGAYLQDVLHHLRHPEAKGEKTSQTVLKKYLNATLRPYQERGVQWLWWLYKMRLGGCLADDMGLGKTIQVLSLLLLIKHQTEKSGEKKPHLLVLPASLLGNWQAEADRFAPSLKIYIAHSSAIKKEKSLAQDQPDLSNIDLVITTYATVHRLPWLSSMQWDMIILDEAQAIKNPTAKQTQAIKKLNGRVRFALTGTPIENRLLDLWSLFDFVAQGLLGSSKIFSNYGKQKSKEDKLGHFYAAVRKLVNPYILRRLKSDKSIINDLPDKTEMQTYCTLTKQQAGLYQQAVDELAIKLQQEDTEGMQRRGIVLSYLLRLKQICNHPNQWLGHGEYDPVLSGKFNRLKEVCELISEKQEKVLIFTQFREVMPALQHFLMNIFGCEGLFLHGQTTVKERAKRVDLFQQENGPPFFILSLKAGGTGLNLTAASHVIHFDRWWNPAVENQATDRAYRIGQKKNVLVHKFICQGTVEEKIDALISDKKSLSETIMQEGGDATLTELSDAELLNMVTLDIHRALGDG